MFYLVYIMCIVIIGWLSVMHYKQFTVGPLSENSHAVKQFLFTVMVSSVHTGH